MRALRKAASRPSALMRWGRRLAGGARSRMRHPKPSAVPRVDVIGAPPSVMAALRGSQWFVPKARTSGWLPSGHPAGIGGGPRTLVAVVEEGARSEALALAQRRVAVIERAERDDDVWLAVGDPQDLKATAAGLASQLEWRDRVAHAQRRAALQAADAEAGRAAPTVSMLVSTNRPDKVPNVLEYAARQTGVNGELVLVTHGFEADKHAIATLRNDAPHLAIVTVPAEASLTLGSCLNLGIDAAGGEWIVKMDDDNFYGAHFLADLERDARLAGAAVAGKFAHYVHLESTGALILRFPYEEHRFARIIQGGTMFMDGDFVRSTRFGDLPRAVDTDLLNRCRAEGLPIYSSDRYNFLSVRMADRHAHTWKVTDASLMSGSGELQFYGDARSHVEV